MPTGFYKRTEYHRRRLREGHTVVRYWLGKKHSKEHIEKRVKKNTGRKNTAKTIEKMRASAIGKKMTPEANKKNSIKKIAWWAIPENRKRMSGINNHLWRGGRIKKQYSTDWTETLKRSIRERDNYTCQVCNKKQKKRKHAVHHIDYDKKNCDPKNLITLCTGCHTKTNTNRKSWIEYFNY